MKIVNNIPLRNNKHEIISWTKVSLIDFGEDINHKWSKIYDGYVVGYIEEFFITMIKKGFLN